MEKIFIKNIEGEQVEVTDLAKAIEQAKEAIQFLTAKQEEHKKNPEVLIFPTALRAWKHDLKELERIVPPKAEKNHKKRILTFLNLFVNAGKYSKKFQGIKDL